MGNIKQINPVRDSENEKNTQNKNISNGVKQKRERKERREKREKERKRIKRKFLSRQDTQNVLDELEFSLGLLEPPIFEVIPVRVSLRKDGRFSGLTVEYKGVKGFVPRHGLKKPYDEPETAQKLVEDGTLIEVHLSKIEGRKPIFTMKENEILEIKLKKESTITLPENITIEILNVEYHKGQEYRPKTIVLRITTPSKYPVIRPEYRTADLERWYELEERSEKRLSVKVRRYFYKEKGRNVVEIDGYKFTILAFFNKKEAEVLYKKGYLCTAKITYPKAR